MAKTKEIKSVTETKETLKQEFEELIQKRTELNVQHQAGQLKQTHEIKQVRRKIADIKRRMSNLRKVA